MTDIEERIGRIADRGDPETAWAIRGMLDAIERYLDQEGRGPLWTAEHMSAGMTAAGEYAEAWSRGHGTAAYVLQGGGSGPLILALREIAGAWSESPNGMSRRLMAAIARADRVAG